MSTRRPPRTGAGEHTASGPLEAVFGPAVCLKLAADRSWETALTQPLHRTQRHDHEVRRWLAAAGDDIAAEIGFATGAFIGLRLRPVERSNAGELLHVLLTGILADHAAPGVWEVLGALDNAAQPRFAGRQPARAEIGVLDRWLTLPTVDLGPPPWTDLRGAAARRPDGRYLLTATLPAPLMLEMLYGHQGDGWLAAPTSRPAPDAAGNRSAHRADPDSLTPVARLLGTAGGWPGRRQPPAER
jgi:hypothetical protein